MASSQTIHPSSKPTELAIEVLSSELSELDTDALSSELSDARTVSSPTEIPSSPPVGRYPLHPEQHIVTDEDDSDTESLSSLEDIDTPSASDTPTQSNKRDRATSVEVDDESPKPKRRRAPKDAPPISKETYVDIMQHFKNRTVSITSFLQFIISSRSKGRKMMEDVLMEPPESARQWMDQLAVRYLRSRGWTSVATHLAEELEAFGNAALQQDRNLDNPEAVPGSCSADPVMSPSSSNTQQTFSPTWLMLFDQILYKKHRPSQEMKQRSDDNIFYGETLSVLAHRMRPRKYGTMGTATLRKR